MDPEIPAKTVNRESRAKAKPDDQLLLVSPELVMTFCPSTEGSSNELVIGAIDERQIEKAVLRIKLPDEATSAKDLLRQAYALAHGSESQAPAKIPDIEAWALGNKLVTALHIPQRECTPFKLDDIYIDSDLDLPLSPTERVDKLTNLRTGAALESSESLKLLDQSIPGPKLFVFIDFDHLSYANLKGLSADVDALLGQLKDVGESCFKHGKHEIFRKGGDEFVIILENKGEESLVELNKFRDTIKELRDASLPADDARMQAAEELAAIKVAAAKVVADARQDSHDFDSFCNAVCQMHGAQNASDAREIGQVIIAVAKESLLEQKSDAYTQGRVMNFSMSVVALPSLTTSDIHKAEGTAEREIFHAKAQGSINSNLAISEINPKIHERRADRNAARHIEAGQANFENRIEQVKAALSSEDSLSTVNFILARGEVERAAAQDQALPGVLRYGLVAHKPVQFFVDLHEPRELSLTTIKLRGFSVLNKVYGYERADEVLNNVSLIFQEAVSGAIGVRVDGGRIKYLHEKDLSQDAIQNFEKKANSYLETVLPGGRLDIEYSLRQALDSLAVGASGVVATSGPLRTVEVSSARTFVDPCDLFSKHLS